MPSEQELFREIDPTTHQPLGSGMGVQSSDLGSFMPVGSYRPMPMTWLVSAWILHSIAMLVLVAFLASKPIFFPLATTLLASVWILHRVLGRGMKDAARGWKIALFVALALNWLLAAVSALSLQGY